MRLLSHGHYTPHVNECHSYDHNILLKFSRAQLLSSLSIFGWPGNVPLSLLKPSVLVGHSHTSES